MAYRHRDSSLYHREYHMPCDSMHSLPGPLEPDHQSALHQSQFRCDRLCSLEHHHRSSNILPSNPSALESED